MDNREMGFIAGDLVKKLYKENEGKIDNFKITKWSHLTRYATGNVLNGLFPMTQVIATMLNNVKTEETQSTILNFHKLLLDNDLTKVSFYQSTGKSYPESEWMGDDFKDAFWQSLMELKKEL